MDDFPRPEPSQAIAGAHFAFHASTLRRVLQVSSKVLDTGDDASLLL
jgi:hypothetical protein